MHKMVNGQKVELDEREEKEVLEDREKNRQVHKKLLEKTKKVKLLEENIKKKMSSLGFSDEEVDFFIKSRSYLGAT